jgi:hypothetical protein
VENSRGKKGKKAIWHLTLGLKDTICAGIGVVGLMMISFALGALAGRGDIYRAASSWGLMSPEAPKMAAWSPQAAPPSPAAPAATAAAPTTAQAGAPAVPPAGVAAAKQPTAAPVTGSIAGVPGPAPEAKKKTKSGHRDKARDEELQRLRQEVAQKLKFQNSFDTAPKPKTAKKEAKGKAAAPTQVRVAQFRDAKSAKAKVAELQKKGIKAFIKQGKDQQGAIYTVYRQSASQPQANEKVAHKPEPGADAKPKTNP